MQVGVVEPGHGEVAAKIDDLRLWAFKLLKIECFADSENAVALYGDRLGALDRGKWSVGGYTGVDVAVRKDYVSFYFRIGGRRGVLP
jgi:hypothetical protein